jgi:hypothetical protein
MHSIIVYFVEALVLFYHMLKVLYYEQTQSEMRCFVLSHAEGVVIFFAFQLVDNYYFK